MSGKILRRCTICKKFHAAYLVKDPQFGTGYLCYSCWKARQGKTTTPPQDHAEEAGKKLKAEISTEPDCFKSTNSS